MITALMSPLINGDMPTLIDVCLLLRELVVGTLKVSHRVLQEHVKQNTNLLSFLT